MKATCLFRSREWRTIRRCRCRTSSLCVSFNLFYFIFFSWLAGNESCLPFLWHYYSISYWLAERVCTIVLCLFWKDACVQITATGCFQVSCVVIVHCVERKKWASINCDDLNLFLNWQRPTERSRTSGTIVWCMLGASHVKSLEQWVRKRNRVRQLMCIRV